MAPHLRRRRQHRQVLALLGAALAIAAGAGAGVDPPAAAQVRAVPVGAEADASTLAATSCPTPQPGVLRASPAPVAARTVALTLDDGPAAATPRVLDVLARTGVHATFFMTGRHVREHPDLARRVAAEGHAIGNHSFTHPQAVAGSRPYGSFDELPLAVQQRQLRRTQRAIVDVTGVTPCVFRAPGGHHTAQATVDLAHRHGLSVAHWAPSSGDSVQSRRWSRASVTRIYTASVRDPGDHPILLLHDGKASAEPESVVTSFRGNTVAALPKVIAWYREHGYEFTTVTGERFG